MYFLIGDDDFIFKINSALVLKKNLIANVSTIKKFWKPKSYGDEATDFNDKEMPKGGSAVIKIDCPFKKDINYCLQEFLKECKYIEKEATRHITENLEISSGDSDVSDQE